MDNNRAFYSLLFGFIGFNLVGHVTSETCNTGGGSTTYCENGCCGSSCCSDDVSTSVLIVACAVSGLVLLALVAAIVICCYKNYRDKQTNRVRNIRPVQERQQYPRVPAEPPKPPTYIEAPPAYSEDLPESHFRPVTVTGGHLPIYNQRFSMAQLRQERHRITTTTSNNNNNNTNNNNSTNNRQEAFERRNMNIHATNTSRSLAPYEYRIAVSENSEDMRRDHASLGQTNISQTSIPGSMELPPPYSEFARGQTPAYARASVHRANNVVRDSPLREETSTTQTTEDRTLQSPETSSINSTPSVATTRNMQNPFTLTAETHIRETSIRDTHIRNTHIRDTERRDISAEDMRTRERENLAVPRLGESNIARVTFTARGSGADDRDNHTHHDANRPATFRELGYATNSGLEDIAII